VELFKHCKPAGVDCINLIQMNFYGFDTHYILAHPIFDKGRGSVGEGRSVTLFAPASGTSLPVVSRGGPSTITAP